MKKILITGCSSGFGFEAAKYLASKGHHVYATMRNVDGKNSGAAEDLRSFAAQEGVAIEVLELDVVSDSSVAAAFSGISELDVLINNAGRGYGGPIESFSADEILAQLDLNIVGTLRTSRAALPIMRKQKSGLIIQVSSVAGRGAFPGFGVYHASKWGLEGVSEAMRYELAPHGIDVVLVEPGPFETNFFGNLIVPEDQEVAEAYAHVWEFNKTFGDNVQAMFADENAPTDSSVVVEIFEKLIDTPNGDRPLRTIAGLDFGFGEMNKATEPFRKAGLESMGIGSLDGPSAGA